MTAYDQEITHMPTPPEIAKSSGAGGANYNGPSMGQRVDPEFTQGGAPGGLTFESDLPSIAVPGGNPASTNGFSPSPAQDPLGRPGSNDGGGTAPTGNRR